MKLLDAITQLSVNNLSNLGAIQTALEMRMDWLNDREPESSGIVYDTWSEKVDDLQEILDYIDNLKESTDLTEQEELIADIQDLVNSYQIIHGGLSRLKL